MEKPGIKRALISVYDKTGIVDFARALVAEFGVEIISTGGTARLLREHVVPVTPVDEVIGFPELMEGRVKTLHPKIHAAVLADRDNPEHMRQLEEHGIRPIDMVVINLYPFEKTAADGESTFEQVIEMIDIGGPCLLRAAAKNHRHVLVVPDAALAGAVLDALRGNDLGDGLRIRCALAAFSKTCGYDAAIASWLESQAPATPRGTKLMQLCNPVPLRYGENPHQRADLFGHAVESADEARLTETAGEAAPGESMSFNNYVDGAAALELCKELTREITSGSGPKENQYGVVFIKHTNACGAGVAGDPVEAYRRAYLGDPNAAMGGIVACSFGVDADFARTVMESYGRWGKEAGAGGFFVEVWIAPSFADEAREVIRNAKKWGERVRLLDVGDLGRAPDPSEADCKKIPGGMLVQTRDLVGLDEERWKVVTARSPSESELGDLRLAWLICKHTKSNAITICKDNMLIGNGAGQMSRVMSCRVATWLAGENGHGERLSGAAAASDAFFPFADGPGILFDAGVTALIQPGGSKRDADTIRACDDRDVAMVFTGTRHFKH